MLTLRYDKGLAKRTMSKDAIFRQSGLIVSFLTILGMYLSGIAIFVTAFFITFEVVARRFFSFSTLVADEWSAYLLVFIAFLGTAYTMKTGGFLQIKFVINRLSPRQNLFLQFFLLLLALLYSLLIEYHLVRYAWSSYATGVVSISISQTPLFIPQMFMPIGMFIFILELIREWIISVTELFAGSGEDNA